MSDSPRIDTSPALPRPPRPFRLEAVLFDFDGTLTAPGRLDFAALKHEIGCPPDRYVLEWALELESEAGRERALAALERFELEGAERSRPNEGAEALVRTLLAQGLPLGVLTRNGLRAVDRALENFETVRARDFAAIVTRDDPVAPKPAPDGVLLACERMGVAPERTLLVGDYVLDAEAGRRAGTVTAFLTNGLGPDPSDVDESRQPDAPGHDFTIHRLEETAGIVGLGRALPEGKLPNTLLAWHLDSLPVDDPALLVSAGVGEDVAAINVAGDEVLVVHGDPITLTGEDLGRYAVRVNANDVATAGATARWFLATVLLPSGASAAEAAVRGRLHGRLAGPAVFQVLDDFVHGFRFGCAGGDVGAAGTDGGLTWLLSWWTFASSASSTWISSGRTGWGGSMGQGKTRPQASQWMRWSFISSTGSPWNCVLQRGQLSCCRILAYIAWVVFCLAAAGMPVRRNGSGLSSRCALAEGRPSCRPSSMTTRSMVEGRCSRSRIVIQRTSDAVSGLMALL